MRTHTITRTVAGGLLVLMTGAGVACSKSAASESSYCDAARTYAVYQLKHPEEGPDAAKADQVAYNKLLDAGMNHSPNSVRANWAVFGPAARQQAALMAKYGYDEAQFNAKASDAEKAVMHGEDPKVSAAFDNILKYEKFTCGTGQPPDADVSFDGEKPGPYCDAVKEDNAHNDTINFGDPVANRAAMTGAANVKASAAMDQRLIDTAPAVIRDDVKAEVAWWNTQQKPVVAKYDYDWAKLLLKGSAKERAAFQLTDKRIANHYARATAYEHQVCGT